MDAMDTIGLITAICGLVWIGIFVVIIPVYFITKDVIDYFFNFKHGYCSKCHHKLKYEKYIDCDNFVKVKHNVIKGNKYE